MLSDTPRTTDEAYVSATTSSNLRCEADKRTDVDVLIAAGCSPGILGAALMRLHSEYDSAAKPAQATLTEALLLRHKLRSLPLVLSVLSAWAAARGMAEPDKLALAVASHWLHSACQPCHGRGSELIPGTPSLGRTCKVCRGTGKRREPMGEAGRKALNMCDDSVNVARDVMRKRLRQYR